MKAWFFRKANFEWKHGSDAYLLIGPVNVLLNKALSDLLEHYASESDFDFSSKSCFSAGSLTGILYASQVCI